MPAAAATACASVGVVKGVGVNAAAVAAAAPNCGKAAYEVRPVAVSAPVVPIPDTVVATTKPGEIKPKIGQIEGKIEREREKVEHNFY